MTNDDFQRIVLEQLSKLNSKQDETSKRQDEMSIRQEQMSTRQDEMSGKLDNVARRQDEMSTRQDQMSKRQDEMSTRQDEIYELVKAIEHSNSVGRSEIDNQKIKAAKIEGKLKKAAKTIISDDGEDELFASK